MGAVDRLVFDGWIPPWIEQHHVGCGGKIEPKTAGAQRNEEDGRAGRALELLNQRAAILRLAGEQKITPAASGNFFADEREHFDELREDEHLVAFFDEWIEQ